MLIEAKNKKEDESRIRCGNCKSEYAPRLKSNTDISIGDSSYDYSCPVCGHGKFNESYSSKNKQILHD